MEPPMPMRQRVSLTHNLPNPRPKTLMAIPSAMHWMRTLTVTGCSTRLKTTAATTPLLKTPEPTQPTPILMATVSVMVQTLLVASVRPVLMPSHTTLQHRWTPMAMAYPTSSLMALTRIWWQTTTTTATSGRIPMRWRVVPTRRTVQAFRSTATLTVFVMRWTKRCLATRRTEPRAKFSKPSSTNRASSSSPT